MPITNESTAAIMFFTAHADFVQIQRVDLWLTSTEKGYVIFADGFEVGVCKPLRNSPGWACILNAPTVSELLTAPNRDDVIGLALRTAQEICAKAAFDP